MRPSSIPQISPSDCHYYNFGVRITAGATEHEVIAIDTASRELAPSDVTKGKLNPTRTRALPRQTDSSDSDADSSMPGLCSSQRSSSDENVIDRWSPDQVKPMEITPQRRRRLRQRERKLNRKKK